MEKRIEIQEIEPQAFEAMYAVEKYIQKSGLKKSHHELIKIRASQINGCAFCINMHTVDAIKAGETAKRIFLLNAWRETTLFTEEEQAILAMTEEITHISQHGLTDESYAKAEKLFNPNYIAQIIMAIVAINSWNRISVATKRIVGE
ncbi:MAG: carboxymuconolactone decarboxylase family protein [Sphingobacteriales bacterium]|nr:MAG: carboxymuconolactone decarboxylase family protein [Sphingobacteriales bacterium]